MSVLQLEKKPVAMMQRILKVFTSLVQWSLMHAGDRGDCQIPSAGTVASQPYACASNVVVVGNKMPSAHAIFERKIPNKASALVLDVQV